MDESTKLKEEKDLGVNGVIIDVTICKSRTGRAGRTVPMVFDYDKGFDGDLSLYIALKNAGVITGAGAYYKLESYPDMKFTQKGFKSKLATDPEFAQAFQTEALNYLKSMINSDDILMEENRGGKNTANAIYGMLTAEMTTSMAA